MAVQRGPHRDDHHSCLHQVTAISELARRQFRIVIVGVEYPYFVSEALIVRGVHLSSVYPSMHIVHAHRVQPTEYAPSSSHPCCTFGSLVGCITRCWFLLLECPDHIITKKATDFAGRGVLLLCGWGYHVQARLRMD